VTAPAAPQPGRVVWLVLAYRLPVNHGLTMTVRRRLTAMGAVYPVNAVAAVPRPLPRNGPSAGYGA
jgi:hypothetical protein